MRRFAGEAFSQVRTNASSMPSPIAETSLPRLPTPMTEMASEEQDSSEMAGSVRRPRKLTDTSEDGSEQGNVRQNTSNEAQRDDEIVFEAEDASFLTPYFEIGQDASASGSKYISAPETNTTQLNESGVAEYRFEVPKTGVYKIIARVFAPTDGSDSFHVWMDTGSNYTWDLPESPDWAWITVGAGGDNELTFRLAAGQHVLRIGNREDGTRLDILVISRLSD